MMMTLGQFVFGLHTLAYQDLSHQMSWRHSSNSRVGVRPARQFLGPGDESINLTGLLVPEFSGAPDNLSSLRKMANDGFAYALVDGTGEPFGAWVIEDLQERFSIFVAEGKPRRIEFDIKLARVDNAQVDASGGINTDNEDWWTWWI